jgi:hypothetical protein
MWKLVDGATRGAVTQHAGIGHLVKVLKPASSIPVQVGLELREVFVAFTRREEVISTPAVLPV